MSKDGTQHPQVLRVTGHLYITQPLVETARMLALARGPYLPQ